MLIISNFNQNNSEYQKIYKCMHYLFFRIKPYKAKKKIKISKIFKCYAKLMFFGVR